MDNRLEGLIRELTAAGICPDGTLRQLADLGSETLLPAVPELLAAPIDDGYELSLQGVLARVGRGAIPALRQALGGDRAPRERARATRVLGLTKYQHPE